MLQHTLDIMLSEASQTQKDNYCMIRIQEVLEYLKLVKTK